MSTTPPPARPQALGLFFEAIWQHKGLFAEALLGTVVLNLIGLATSLYSMQVYDRVIPNAGLSTLWVLTVGVLVAMLLELVLKHVRSSMVDKACKAIDLGLSERFFGHALAIRMDKRPATIGTFAAQIRLFESVRQFLTSTTLFVLADIPFALVFIAVIGLIAGPVALVPLLLVPLSLLTGLVFIRPIARLTQANVVESTLKNGLLIESVDGIETIKSLQAESAFASRWRALTETMGEGELKLKALSGLSGHMTALIQQLSYVGMIALGVTMIMKGELTMGGLIACSIISGRALGPIAQLSSILVQWQHTQAALQGLDAMLAMPADGVSPTGQLVRPQTCRHELRVDQLSFAYLPQHETLQVNALQIKPGERVALIGPIGSGKSTLLKVLSGLYQPSSGRAFLDGVDMAHLDPAFLRAQVRHLPQDARLFNGSLRENLILGLADPGDEAILNAARATGLDTVIAQHPLGLGLPISEGGQGLSGGQRQLVTLTRLMLAPGGIVLLDEPTASLDGGFEDKAIAALTQALQPDDVLLMVTHKTGLLKVVQRVIVMDKGRIVMDGPRDAMLARLMGPPAATNPGLPGRAA
jgi:ATP-binding cassette subfamily C protein LapB